MPFNNETLDFLDVRVTKFGQSLSTDLFRKKTGAGTVFYMLIAVTQQVHSVSQGGDIDVKPRSRETFWIFTLDTQYPKGLNQEIDYGMSYWIVFSFFFLIGSHSHNC